MQFATAQAVKLSPFFISLVLYFGLVRKDPQGELWTTLLKCLPIVSLMLYILIKGFSLKKHYRFSQLILLGLIFSCGGDALLNINLFPFGMVSFGVAHIFYISAFGWQPIKWLIGVILYMLVTIFIILVSKHLDEILVIGVPIYCVIITTMLWRSLARAVDLKSLLAICCAAGAFLFVISDALIAVTMFLNVAVPGARLQIMITYYAAQFAIVLSSADDGPERIIKNKTK